MPMIAAPVAAWVIGAGGTAAMGAVAGAVAAGVVTGAVVGAGVAAVTGGDIFQGALKGAIYGGISGGVLSGAGIATGLASAESQLAKFGLDTAGNALSTSASAAAGTPGAAINPSMDTSVAKSIGATVPTQSAAGNAGQGILSAGNQAVKTPMSDEKLKIYSGIGQGLAEGVGKVGAAKMEATAARDLAEWQQQQDNITKSSNVPGQFQAKIANIQIPENWKTYFNPNEGLLAQGSV